ncbi:ABC transporter ATP-binding protein [Geosporobacter ferrireducens]|uniref:Macrolide ABC transporter ATP-binding protein n=1 Tax=Geosporobacter ferrireducens TaxID=1424294 RepID=A0A1D8GH48_9FIRM|nr:ABC transporter ATP-binding protein [Geosporobacter ferrireducens]AOT70198.1 macrolide ABC transporter ATP-binding protein [Geosporobacter ferrireducens]MTI53255.1 ABC transporter ATP-binding protein [Geosporobacter ferrireducens]
MNHAVEINHVRKVYRVGEQKVVALNDISLQIPRGEVCCLLGTSGSGKTTLLNLMAGLEKPTKGTIQIEGKSIEKMDEQRLAEFRQRYVGFVFQSYNLLPSLTALENVSLPLTFRGMKKQLRENAALDLLKAVGLKRYATHKPTQMSGGQQQRVGIARAFVGKPPIVFADEPTGNLDSKTTHEVMQLILEMAKQNNQTLILVTHDRSIAAYADRVVYILDGHIEKIEINHEKYKGENQ